MINDLIIELLEVNATTGVSANLFDSAAVAQRVYHRAVWQGHQFPAVVYVVLSETDEKTKAGRKIDEFDVSFIVRHKIDFEAKTIAYNIRSILEGWAGTFGGSLWYRTEFTRLIEGYDWAQELPAYNIDFHFSKPA